MPQVNEYSWFLIMLKMFLMLTLVMLSLNLIKKEEWKNKMNYKTYDFSILIK